MEDQVRMVGLATGKEDDLTSHKYDLAAHKYDLSSPSSNKYDLTSKYDLSNPPLAAPPPMPTSMVAGATA